VARGVSHGAVGNRALGRAEGLDEGADLGDQARGAREPAVVQLRHADGGVELAVTVPGQHAAVLHVDDQQRGRAHVGLVGLVLAAVELRESVDGARSCHHASTSCANSPGNAPRIFTTWRVPASKSFNRMLSFGACRFESAQPTPVEITGAPRCSTNALSGPLPAVRGNTIGSMS